MRLRSRSILAPLFIAGFVALSLTAASGEALANPMIRPATRSMFATIGMGPAIKLDDVPTQFKLEIAAGWHFSGDGTGPAIGLALAPSFGESATLFSIGPRFWWDIQPSAAMGLYLAPFAQIGFAHYSIEVCGPFGQCVGGSTNAFQLMFGFEVRLALANRGMVFFRPLGIDLFINDDGVGARYDLMFGGGVYFP